MERDHLQDDLEPRIIRPRQPERHGDQHGDQRDRDAGEQPRADVRSDGVDRGRQVGASGDLDSARPEPRGRTMAAMNSLAAPGRPPPAATPTGFPRTCAATLVLLWLIIPSGGLVRC